MYATLMSLCVSTSVHACPQCVSMCVSACVGVCVCMCCVVSNCVGVSRGCGYECALYAYVYVCCVEIKALEREQPLKGCLTEVHYPFCIGLYSNEHFAEVSEKWSAFDPSGLERAAKAVRELDASRE